MNTPLAATCGSWGIWGTRSRFCRMILPFALLFWAWAGIVNSVTAASPIASHPAAPAITAVKAIEIATKFVGATANTKRYCSSITLDEGGMTPAPSGSARHWIVVFQDAGAERADVRTVYVDMQGRPSDTVPPMGR